MTGASDLRKDDESVEEEHLNKLGRRCQGKLEEMVLQLTFEDQSRVS